MRKQLIKIMDKISKKMKFASNDKMTILLIGMIIINFLPLWVINAFVKHTPSESSTVIEVACMMIEFLTLFLFFVIHYKEVKFNKKKILMLCTVTFVMFLAQIKNYVQGVFYFKDILNIGIFFVNVFFFYIIIYDYKIKEKVVLKFYKFIVYFALFAILWNTVMFFNEIIAQVGIINSNFDYSAINNIKGFFGNRAALSFTILLAIISNELLKQYKDSSKINLLYKVLFYFGIWSTHSKTSFILMVLLYLFFIIIDNKKIIKKVLLSLVLITISVFGFLNVLGYFPKNIEKDIEQVIIISEEEKENDVVENREESNSKLNELVVGKNRLYKLSGRTAIWESVAEHLKNSPIDLIFGVGKFSSARFLTVDGKLYQHFHNLAIELIMTGGLIELAYVVVIFGTVIKKIFKSDLMRNVKLIYFSSFGMYLIISMMETYGKFSIGYHDVLCLVFFIAIPLLHANSEKERKVI